MFLTKLLVAVFFHPLITHLTESHGLLIKTFLYILVNFLKKVMFEMQNVVFI